MDIEKKLRGILHSNRLDLRETEPILGAAVSIVQFAQFHVYIYGAGNDVDVFVKFLQNEGIEPAGIIDRDKNKWGRNIQGIEIISPDSFKQDAKLEKIYVFIYTHMVQGSRNEKQILSLLNSAKVIDWFVVGDLRYSVAGYMPEYAWLYEGRCEYYSTHEEQLLWLMDELADMESKRILLEYIRTHVECSHYKLEEIPSKLKYFYGLNGENIYRHLEDEVWINCGADEGGTIVNYFLNHLSAKRIYAVEGNIDTVEALKANLKLFPNDVFNRIDVVQHFITGDGGLSEYFRQRDNEHITFINADIEGFEMHMLKELEKIIKRDRPVLAICVYHKKEDLVTIPAYISSLVCEYKFFLRKYATWVRGDTRKSLELILYAIPIERVDI